MEVACGEHGDHMEKLVRAVDSGNCCIYDTRTPESNTTPAMSTSDTSKEFGQHKKSPQEGSQQSTTTTCTMTLLDSSEDLPDATKNTRFPVSGWTQFWILLKRTAFSTFRDQHLTRLRLLAHCVIGVLLGLIYYDIGNEASKVMSNAGCIFFTVMFTQFTAMMPTIITFPLEMAVFVREHLNYWYSIKAYYFAKTVADIPFQLLLTICYMMGVYYITSQPMEPSRFAMAILISVLTALVSQSIGLLVGIAFNLEGGIFVGPIAMIPMVLLSGFFVNIKDIPFYIKWLPYVSYVKYSFEGMLISIYGLDRPTLNCSEAYCYYKYPKKFLSNLSMNGDLNTYIIDVTVLTGLFIFIRICVYFVLRIKLSTATR